jgi:hypothetical protein
VDSLKQEIIKAKTTQNSLKTEFLADREGAYSS